IWGTVRRPVRSIITARCAGSRSIWILWMSATPRWRNRASARMQYGHTAVQYMVTWGMGSSGEASGFLEGHPRLTPAVDAAFQRGYPIKAVLAQGGKRTGGFPALAVDQDQGFVLGQSAGLCFEVGHRNIARLGDAAGLELFGWPQVDEQAV